MSRVNPDLVRERNRPAEVAEPWDRAVMGIYSVLLVMLMVLAALDGGRYHWSDIPLAVQATGWVLLVIACTIVWHVMMTNAYLSSWARIQDDRGQVVVRDGLYGYIRHPMYAGILIAFLALPMVLNSWWSMIPAVLIIGIFIYRTYREDRLLLESLEGYAEYQQEVRYRLIPGIW
jgi:protein-S-isoprenylcysteine O-methyltransferase Ste14